MQKSAEKELEEFLASLPAYKRKEFQLGALSLTQDEVYEWCKVEMTTHSRLRDEYEHLLRRVPAKWREYRKREANANAELMYPANRSGRPRKDDLANEAAQLQESGLSYARIAMQLNREHGEGTTTKENIRGLLKARRLHASEAAVPPEKT